MKEKLEIAILLLPSHNLHSLKCSNHTNLFSLHQIGSYPQITTFPFLLHIILGLQSLVNHLQPSVYVDISHFCLDISKTLLSIPFVCVHSCLTPLCSSDIPKGKKTQKINTKGIKRRKQTCLSQELLTNAMHVTRLSMWLTC